MFTFIVYVTLYIFSAILARRLVRRKNWEWWLTYVPVANTIIASWHLLDDYNVEADELLEVPRAKFNGEDFPNNEE